MGYLWLGLLVVGRVIIIVGRLGVVVWFFL